MIRDCKNVYKSRDTYIAQLGIVHMHPEPFQLSSSSHSRQESAPHTNREAQCEVTLDTGD